MKRKTKLVSILLALLIVTLLVSCIPKKSETDSSSDRSRESDGNIVEKVTDDDISDDTSEVPKLTYWMELESANILTSHDEKMCYQEIQEKLGIDIEWIHPAQGQAEEQFNLLIVSDELPDLIHYNWLNYPGGPEAAMEGKLIIKLNEYIEEKSPNLKGYLEKFPEVDMMIKTDTGTYYSYPYIYTSTPPESKDYKQASERIPAYETYLGMIIRKDWLDDLNLEEPVTLDDWYNTLKLFKEEKGAEAPLSITEDFLKRTSVFISAFDITHFMFEDDKKVKYGPAEPIYRDYLEYMNKLYSEKLLDNDFAVLDNSAFSAKVLSNQTGIWSGYTSSHLGVFHDQLHEKDPDSEFYPIGIANPVREEGQGLKYRQATYPIVGHGTAITVDCEDIDAACKFLDYGYSDEGSMLYNWGPEGEAYEFVDTWPEFTEKILNDPDGLTPTGAFGKYRLQNGPFVIDHWTRLSSKGSYNTPESIDAMIVWEDESGDSPSTLPPVTLLPEESQEYANKFNEIETYVSEMFTKFVMGDVPLSEFDKYIENLEKMGINDVIDIQQKALDRYYSR